MNGDELAKIKAESNELSGYFSGTYRVYSFVFVLQLYPKKKTNFGDDDDDETKSNEAPGAGQDVSTSKSCIINLYLVKVPYNVGCVAVEYTHNLIETDSHYSWRSNFVSNRSCVEWDKDLVFWSQIEKLESLTFITDIQILTVYDKNGKDITFDIVNEQKDPDPDATNEDVFELAEQRYYECKIAKKYYAEDSAQGNVYRSEIFELFGFKWYIWFIPRCYRYFNDMCCYICRADFPLNIESISFHCKISIVEI